MSNAQTGESDFYNYEQDRAVESLEQVYNALVDSHMPWRFISGMDQELSLSIGSIYNHLQKLMSEGLVIHVGRRYVAVEKLDSMESHQLVKLRDSASQNVQECLNLEQRLQRRFETRKKQLHELKDEMSSWKFRQEEQEIISILDSKDYLEDKRKVNREAVKAISQVLGDAGNGKTEKLCLDSDSRSTVSNLVAV